MPALLHNHPERIRDAVAAASAGHDVVAVAYGDCGTYGALDSLGLPRLAGEHCYDVFARDEVRAALEEEPGTYFLTDFLARTFEHTVWRRARPGSVSRAARRLLRQLHARDVAGAAADAGDAGGRFAGRGTARVAPRGS